MTTSDSDKDKENESPDEKQDTTEDRLGEIKKEEKEDASSYYAQGDKESPMNVKEEFAKPVPPVEKAKEDLNLLRAVAFLGFGLAVLAIVFILFFIRDLDERVGGVDSAVKKVEEIIQPLKTEVEDNMKVVQSIEENLKTVSDTVSRLHEKLGDYEKSMAIMELKRALAMIEGISMGSNASVRSKSSDVAASIQSLLSELGGGEGVSDQPAGEIQVEEAAEEPAGEESAVEESAETAEEPAEEELAGEESEEAAEEEPAEEESAGEESEEAAEEPSAEESAGEESEEAAEEPAEEESTGEESEEAGEELADEESAEEESAGEESVEAEKEPAGESHVTEESNEEAPAESEEHGEESASDDIEDLPTIEELLKE